MDMGLSIGGTYGEASEEVEEGLVIRSEPAAGERVESGSEVTLVVSSGPSSVTMDLVAVSDRYWDPTGISIRYIEPPDYGHGPQLVLWAVPAGAGLAAIRFDLTDIPSEATVEEAVLHMYLEDGDEGSVRVSAQRTASSWMEDEDTRPECDPSELVVIDVDPDSGWYIWDITTIVQNQHASRLKNYGICLGPISLTSLAFTSREGPDKQRPFLTITYRP
jgi:hypothetical protein